MMVEVIVVSSIITVALLASLAVAQKSVLVSRQSLHVGEAAFLLEEGAEAMRTLRDSAWSNISGLAAATNYYPAFTGGAWTLAETPSTVGIFTRAVTVSAVNRDNTTSDISASGTNDPGTKLVVVTVSWNEAGTTVSKTLSFYIFDIFS